LFYYALKTEINVFLRPILRFMKTYVLVLILMVGLAKALVAQPYTGISLQKNKPYTERLLPAEKTGEKGFRLPKRIFNNTVTRYNYVFNATMRLEGIIERATEKQIENYAALLPFYPYSLETTAKDEIDTIIYKCTAGILLHDLRSDWVDNLYIILGKAYLHRQDYDSAIGVFKYVNYAFAPKDEGSDIPIGSNISNANGVFTISTDEKRNIWKKITTTLPSRNESFLWMIRTYLEQNKQSEAAGLMALLRTDKIFPARLIPALDELAAYSNYKGERYEQAATFLAKTIPFAESKKEKSRKAYLTAQLFEKSGVHSLAKQYYQKAIDVAQDPYLEIYANVALNRLAVTTGADSKALLLMAKRDKYEAYKEVIYFAAASIELSKNNYALTQNYLLESIKNSGDNELQKQKSFVLLGDINYDQKKYGTAYKYYDSVNIENLEVVQKEKIETRKPALQLINANLTIIELEDSLQKIAALPEIERTVFLRKLYKQLRKEKDDIGTDKIVDPNSGGSYDLFNTGTSSDFYFLNKAQRSNGFTTFKTSWGNRQNLDNWRRQAALDAAIGASNVNVTAATSDVTSKDSSSAISYDALAESIPTGPKQLEASNEKWAKALLDNAQIFQLNLSDYPSAIDAYSFYTRKFATNTSLDIVYHNLALCYRVIGNQNKADSVQKLFQVKLPSSKLLVKKEPAINNTTSADLSFNIIYEYFSKGEYEKALALKEEVTNKYGKDIWAPQFLFMEATVLMKNKEDSAATKKLNKITTDYPGTAIAKKAVEVLEVLKQREKIEKEINKQPTKKEEGGLY
jgi:tetratricopeptide (TPR) repeat protein